MQLRLQYYPSHRLLLVLYRNENRHVAAAVPFNLKLSPLLGMSSYSPNMDSSSWDKPNRKHKTSKQAVSTDESQIFRGIGEVERAELHSLRARQRNRSRRNGCIYYLEHLQKPTFAERR